MKKFLLLSLISSLLFLTTPAPIYAAQSTICNQSDTPEKVFKFHGTKEKKEPIAGECLDEFLTAMGSGKDININYANIKGEIDFANTNYFPAHSLEKARKDLSPGDIAHIEEIYSKWNMNNKIVLIKGKIIIKHSNIKKWVKHEKPHIILFKKNVGFYKTIFSGEFIYFNSAKFDGEASFRSAQFNGGAIFTSAQFNGGAIFTSAQFNRGAYLRFAKFDGVTYFSSANFDREAYFDSAKFGGVTSFAYANFDGEASFRSANFVDVASFRLANFDGLAYFSSAKFGDNTYFKSAIFNKKTVFNFCSFDGKTSFTSTKFADCVFNNSTFGIRSSYSNKHFTRNNILKAIAKDVDEDTTAIKKADLCFKRVITGKTHKANNVHIDLKDPKKKIPLSPKTITILKAYSSHVRQVTKSDDYSYTTKEKEKIINEIYNQIILDKKLQDKEKILNEIKKLNAQKNTLFSLITKIKRLLSKNTDKLITYTVNIPISQYIVDLPEENESDPNTKIYFDDVTFKKFAEFQDTLFLADASFERAKFKEVGLFDGAIFFNAKDLGLVEENNENSLISLYLDQAYFNLWKGVNYDQLFPNLNKHLKHLRNADGVETKNTINRLIKNYTYLQDNFKKTGEFEDALKIFRERKRLEAEVEEHYGRRAMNAILNITCEYGTSFSRLILFSLSIVFIFAILFYIIPIYLPFLGLMGVRDQDFKAIGGNPSLGDSLYLSFNNFATLGTGDVIATRFLRILVLMEGVLGWLMLGLVIMTLSTQYLQ
jgi:hypothetical protein